MTTVPGATTFPSEPPQKKFSVSELGVIFWGSPLFLAVFGHRRVRGATTLNFGPISTKLGEIVRPSKKNDPEGQRTRSRPELRRNGRFYVRPKSGFWPKNGSYPKKSPKMTFSPLIIWAKATFSLNNFFRSWPEHGESPKVYAFCGPKILVFGPKIRFLPYDPNFGS